MNCPTDDQLQRLATGQLSGLPAEPIEKHIVYCPPCRARYSAIGPATFPARNRRGQPPANQRGRQIPGAPEVGDATADLAIGNLALDLSTFASLAAPLDGSISADTLSQSIPGYKILSEIHRGGQGVVYQAIQKATRRRVAVKVMQEGPFAGARDRARFAEHPPP